MQRVVKKTQSIVQTSPWGTVRTAVSVVTQLSGDNVGKNWLKWLNQKGNTMTVTLPAEERKAVTLVFGACSLSTQLSTCCYWHGRLSSGPFLHQLLLFPGIWA